MKITINGRDIPLNPTEVRAAKRTVAKFFKRIEDLSAEARRPTFYFTTIIMMLLMYQNYLELADEDILTFVYESLEKTRKQQIEMAKKKKAALMAKAVETKSAAPKS